MISYYAKEKMILVLPQGLFCGGQVKNGGDELETLEKTKNTEMQDLPKGLTSSEVEALRAEGKVNVSDTKSGKSYGAIIGENLCTFFNMVWAIVSVVLIAIGSFSNLTFLAIVIPNILIAIIQEIRAKRTVEKLSVTTEPHATVIRDGEKREIDAKDIVLGDVMYVEMGHQLLADGEVICGVAEANESMLTGKNI